RNTQKSTHFPYTTLFRSFRVQAGSRRSEVGKKKLAAIGGSVLSTQYSVLSTEQPTIEIIGARHNNLKNINVAIPLGTLTAITGPDRKSTRLNSSHSQISY